MVDLNRIIDGVLAEKLAQSSKQSQIGNTFPQVDMSQVIGSEDFVPRSQQVMPVDIGQTQSDIEGFVKPLPTEDPRLVQMQNLNISNEGAPLSVRTMISAGQINDPKLQEKNILFQLQKYYKNNFPNQITDEYDFGLRVGPSGNYEYKDPSKGGQYNIIDPIGLDVGDIADLTGDIPTLVAEVSAGIYGGRKKGFVGATGGAAAAGYITEYLRLYSLSKTGQIPELNANDIHDQAANTALWGVLGSAGGQIAYKVVRPILSTLGILPPKLRMDMDEESFIKAWNTYKDTSSRRLAEEKGIAPTSAQVAEFAAASAQKSGDEKAASELFDLASILAQAEQKVAKSPNVFTGANVRIPTIETKLKAKKLLEKEASGGLDQSRIPNINEQTYLNVGEFVQKQAVKKYDIAKKAIDDSIDARLVNLETNLDNIANLPPNIAKPSQIGELLQEELAKSYDKVKASFDKNYESVYKRWEDGTGLKRDEIIVKQGQVIKPIELLSEVESIKRTFSNRPFINPEEKKLIDNIYESFTVLNEKTGRRKLKPLSLRIISDNLKDLRRLERQAYLKARTGTDAPYADTLTNLIDKLEKTRNRVLSRKGAPDTLVDELKALDDGFSAFSVKFKNANTSAIAKIRKSLAPEDAFNVLFTKDATGKSKLLELTNELKKNNNKELFEYVSDSIRKRWLSEVVTRDKSGVITGVNMNRHKAFLEKHGTIFNEFLSEAEKRALSTGTVKEFGEELVKTQGLKRDAYREVENILKLEGGRLDKPETLFQEVWRSNEISKFNKTIPIIRQNEEVFNSFKSLIYKDMFDPSKNRVVKQGNIIVPNVDLIETYIAENKQKLVSTFGSQYLKNLEDTLKAVRPALSSVKPVATREDNNIITTALRSFVGVFTRPGRILTAINKARGRLREDALVQGLINPEKLALMAKASSYSPEHSEAVKLLGRIFFTGDRTFATEEETNIESVSNAKALLEQLENNR